jgi:hypothetical protein
MNKVLCKNCKLWKALYHHTNFLPNKICTYNREEYTYDPIIGTKKCNIGNCYLHQKYNKNNNCVYYKKKWWLFWIKY